jgi:hypothetical protein
MLLILTINQQSLCTTNSILVGKLSYLKVLNSILAKKKKGAFSFQNFLISKRKGKLCLNRSRHPTQITMVHVFLCHDGHGL